MSKVILESEEDLIYLRQILAQSICTLACVNRTQEEACKYLDISKSTLQNIFSEKHSTYENTIKHMLQTVYNLKNSPSIDSLEDISKLIKEVDEATSYIKSTSAIINTKNPIEKILKDRETATSRTRKLMSNIMCDRLESDFELYLEYSIFNHDYEDDEVQVNIWTKISTWITRYLGDTGVYIDGHIFIPKTDYEIEEYIEPKEIFEEYLSNEPYDFADFKTKYFHYIESMSKGFHDQDFVNLLIKKIKEIHMDKVYDRSEIRSQQKMESEKIVTIDSTFPSYNEVKACEIQIGLHDAICRLIGELYLDNRQNEINDIFKSYKLTKNEIIRYNLCEMFCKNLYDI